MRKKIITHKYSVSQVADAVIETMGMREDLLTKKIGSKLSEKERTALSFMFNILMLDQYAYKEMIQGSWITYSSAVSYINNFSYLMQLHNNEQIYNTIVERLKKEACNG